MKDISLIACGLLKLRAKPDSLQVLFHNSSFRCLEALFHLNFIPIYVRALKLSTRLSQLMCFLKFFMSLSVRFIKKKQHSDNTVFYAGNCQCMPKPWGKFGQVMSQIKDITCINLCKKNNLKRLIALLLLKNH